LTLVLANARHIRNVPGRKSDQKDAAWIADLLAHELIEGSFVPPAPIQELRDLTRTRKQLVAEIARHTQRLQKTLEDANVKPTRVVSDIPRSVNPPSPATDHSPAPSPAPASAASRRPRSPSPQTETRSLTL